MPYYRVAGEIPRKRHVRFRGPDGALYAEELMGEEGFTSDSSLLYHVHPPTAIVKSEGLDDAAEAAGVVPNHPLLPRHFRTQELPAGGDMVLGRQPLLANDDVRISFAAANAGSELYRNSTGDEAIYLRSGSARFESVYGSIDAAAGDYVVMPRGTTHRWIPGGDEPVRAWSSRRADTSARRGGTCRSTGQLLEHAPYCERDLRGPDGPMLAEGEDVPVHRPQPRRADPADLRVPPVRRGRLGRLPVPVRVQHRRLRADREATHSHHRRTRCSRARTS